MAANVESMFFVGRQVPWHGLGRSVKEAPGSKEALIAAGLDWDVYQEPLYTESGILVPDMYANIRSTDKKVLGAVGKKYAIVQNRDAFAFTDDMLGEGVKYETAGSLSGGKVVWLLARLPEKYKVGGDATDTWLCFSTSHDGSSAVHVAVVPVRVVCQNTLNLALRRAKRSWTTRHTGDIAAKVEDAKNSLFMAETYMKELQEEAVRLKDIKIESFVIKDLAAQLFPYGDKPTDRKIENTDRVRNELFERWRSAPDLAGMPHDAFRAINAVSDLATHSVPLRKTEAFEESRFSKTVLSGNSLMDKAMEILMAA